MMMKTSIVLGMIMAVSSAWSQVRPRPNDPRPPRYEDRNYELEAEISSLTRDILDSVRIGRLSREELLAVRDGLRQVSQTASGMSSSSGELICTKGSNGLFYPTKASTGSIVGSTSYSAGYGDFESCRTSLPNRWETLACFKQSNGLFYPANTDTGAVVGSTSYSAGHGSQQECKQTLPKNRSKVACFKQSNGLFYPTNADTGVVIGSTSYSAGFGDLNSCLRVTNQ